MMSCKSRLNYGHEPDWENRLRQALDLIAGVSYEIRARIRFEPNPCTAAETIELVAKLQIAHDIILSELPSGRSKLG